MTALAHSRDTDAAAIPLWDSAYDPAVLGGQGNLCGDSPGAVRGDRGRAFPRPRRQGGARPALRGRAQPAAAGRGSPILLAGDASPKAMAIAEKVTDRAGVRDRVVFVQVDAFDTGLLDASVDGIFCWDLLGRLTDRRRRCAELAPHPAPRRPPGREHVDDERLPDLDPNIKEIGPKEYIDHFDFYCRFYDRADLDALLAEVGTPAAASRGAELVGAAARRLPRLRPPAREPDLHHRQAGRLSRR